MLVVVAMFAISIAAAKAATGFQPLELSVDGDEESWHAEPGFALRWSNPPGVAAVHYRLLDPSGQTSLAEAKIGWAATAIQQLTVPQEPGAYIAEVWLEDSDGNEGTPVTARLRFDEDPPGQVDPQPPGGWIGRNGFPLTLSLSQPPAPQPLSGIRGYAVSIDHASDGEPCADPFICSEDETDLRTGIGGDSLAITELPEGTSYIHAVAVSGSGVRSALAGSAIVRVDKTDPVTRLAAVPEGWSSRPLTLTATATDADSGMTATGDGPTPFTAIRIDGGSPSLWPRGYRLRHRDRVRRPHGLLLRPRRRRQHRRWRQQQRPAEPCTRNSHRPNRPRPPSSGLLGRPGPRRSGADRRSRVRCALGDRPFARRDLGAPGRFGRALRNAAGTRVRCDPHCALGFRGLPTRGVRVPRHHLRPRRKLRLNTEPQRRGGDAAEQSAQGGDDAARRLRAEA